MTILCGLLLVCLLNKFWLIIPCIYFVKNEMAPKCITKDAAIMPLKQSVIDLMCRNCILSK